MQVFVKRSALTLAADEVVPVMAYYDDSVAITPEMQRPEFTLLSVASTAMQPGATGAMSPELMQGWREASKSQIAHGEAARRILAAFPEYSQRNSAHEENSYLIQYGADAGKWPKAAQLRKAEIDRCWVYVDSVRATANALLSGALPADPTVDSHWPTRIASYQSG